MFRNKTLEKNRRRYLKHINNSNENEYLICNEYISSSNNGNKDSFKSIPEKLIDNFIPTQTKNSLHSNSEYCEITKPRNRSNSLCSTNNSKLK